MINNYNIQYGGAWSAPDHWRNFDCSPTLRFERLPLIGKLYSPIKKRFPENVEYGDIVKSLPIDRNSCEFVYCSHVLEHLSLNDCKIALSNTYRIMQKGAVFRFVLPDLEYLARQYIDDSTLSALEFMDSLDLGSRERPNNIRSFIYDYFQNSRHYWMWDYVSLSDELQKAGFTDI